MKVIEIVDLIKKTRPSQPITVIHENKTWEGFAHGFPSSYGGTETNHFLKVQHEEVEAIRFASRRDRVIIDIKNDNFGSRRRSVTDKQVGNEMDENEYKKVLYEIVTKAEKYKGKKDLFHCIKEQAQEWHDKNKLNIHPFYLPTVERLTYDAQMIVSGDE